MHSLRELYRVGHGPSSSHTMAPKRAAQQFAALYPDAARFRATLFGSLAATGRGHLTDCALASAFAPRPVKIDWRPGEEPGGAPNGMKFEALGENGEALGEIRDHSLGGGALASDPETSPIYPHETMGAILADRQETGEPFWRYVEQSEGPGIWDYFDEVWTTMCAAIERGLKAEGRLPGALMLGRRAGAFLERARDQAGNLLQADAWLAAYSYAVAEENAASGVVVTAPTCGSSGVVPAAFYYLSRELRSPREQILRAVATAGLFGNVIKRNGSISGAAVGCQGEVGAACAMASAGVAQLLGGGPAQIEYAAEMGLEHHLGLTCDPVLGLVQIPCIERNAHAAARALSCGHFALLSDGEHRIGFDDVIEVMMETGRALPAALRETSVGGLAAVYRKRARERLGQIEQK